MTSTGPVAIQGCAIRISRLNANGSISAASATGMIQDDKPMIKFTAKPNVLAGVEMTPVSACGAPLIAYKDYDRIKRWDGQLDLGDVDFDKWEMVGGGALITAATNAGRSFADGVTTINTYNVSSAALGAFVSTDVGRAITGTGIPANTFVVAVNSSTSLTISQAATASGTTTLTLGALASRTIGYSFPKLLEVANPNGVAIEIWQKLIVRGTGFQGITPYPSVGSLVTPALNPSGYLRWGIFRFIPTPMDITMEPKEGTRQWNGWCIENPLFGLGPAKDWTEYAVPGAAPVDTTKWCNAMADFALPSPLQPGYQTTAA